MQKQIVLDTLGQMKNHPSATQVYEKVHETYPTISKSTVFRILDQGSVQGDVMRISLDTKNVCYESMTKAHYHIRCRVCQCVEDIPVPYMEGLMEQVLESFPYVVEGHNVEFFGICGKCQQA